VAASAPGAQPVDELTPIAAYMAREMNVNARSPVTQTMRRWNSSTHAECVNRLTQLPVDRMLMSSADIRKGCQSAISVDRFNALRQWTTKVAQNADWDHKPKISVRFNPRNPGGQQHWHLYGTTLYFYDCWSNIHYGYVGVAAGFSESVLLDGAGLEQIGSTLARRDLPEHSEGVSGLRAWDDPTDRAGIELGIALYRERLMAVTPQLLLRRVLATKGLRTQAFNPQASQSSGT